MKASSNSVDFFLPISLICKKKNQCQVNKTGISVNLESPEETSGALPTQSWAVFEGSRFPNAVAESCPSISWLSTLWGIFQLRHVCDAYNFLAEKVTPTCLVHIFMYMNAHTLPLGDNKHCLLLLDRKREAGKGVAALQSAKWPTAPQWEAWSYVAH